MEDADCIVDIVRVSKPGTVGGEHGTAAAMGSDAPIPGAPVVPYYDNAGGEKEELTIHPMRRRDGRQAPAKSNNSDDGEYDRPHYRHWLQPRVPRLRMLSKV
jgi:hypothetical protein